MQRSSSIPVCAVAFVLATVAGTLRAEVAYEYYPGEQHNLPDFAALKAEKTGTVADFDMTLGGAAAEENYTVRYQGGLKIEKDAAYTFHTNSDDGSRLWIDDKLVVNNDGDHAAQEASGKIKLGAGVHKIVVAFYQAGGDRVLEVSYEGGGVAKTKIPKELLSAKVPTAFPPTPNIPGNVAFEYFEGEYDSVSGFAAAQPVSKGTSFGFDMTADGKAREENYGIRFTAQIAIAKEGEYTFYTESDDGSKLLIDDKEVVNNDGDHANEEKEGKVTLTAGAHKIVVLFYQKGGEKSLKVSYAGPDIEKRVIPDAVITLKQ